MDIYRHNKTFFSNNNNVAKVTKLCSYFLVYRIVKKCILLIFFQNLYITQHTSISDIDYGNIPFSLF